MHVNCTCSIFCRANKRDRENYEAHRTQCVDGYLHGNRAKPCHFCQVQGQV